MPCSANCATGVHACFGATSGTSSRSRATSGFVERRAGRRASCSSDVELAVRRTSSRSRASRLVARSARRVAEVELDARARPARRSCAMPPSTADGAQRPRGRRARRARRRAARAPTSRARPRTSAWIAFTPVHGRAECALSPWKVDARLDVAEAAGVEDAVGRLEHDRELGVAEQRRSRRAPGSGLSDDRHLLAREEEVAAPGAPRARARSSPRRRPSCRSRRGRARRRPSIRPGMLPCAGTVSRWPASSDRRAGSPYSSASPSS